MCVLCIPPSVLALIHMQPCITSLTHFVSKTKPTSMLKAVLDKDSQ